MQEEEREVRVQILEEGSFNKGKLYRLKIGWILRLQPSSSIVHKHVRVFCNMPPNADQTFERNVYYEYEWRYLPNSLLHDHFNKYLSIDCKQAGSYAYYFTLDGSDKRESSAGGSNFLIDPSMRLKDGTEVSLDSLQMQTVLAKQLGPLDEWRSRLQVSHECGYNVMHFTPCQELSAESNSSYCLRDHMKLLASASGPDQKYNMNDLGNLVCQMHAEWGVFSICDLVYNHMSNDAEFVQRYPNAAYNLVNSAHLRPAFVVDRVLYHITVSIESGAYESRGLSASQASEHQMEIIRHIIRDEELPRHRVHEFYTIDVVKTMQQIKAIGLAELEHIERNIEAYRSKPRREDWVLNEEKEKEWQQLRILQDKQYRRLMSTIDHDLVKRILAIEFERLNLNLDLKNSDENSQFLVRIYEQFQHELQKQNEQVRSHIESCLTEATNNVISNMYYHFFAHDGPRWPKVDRKHPIVFTYFYYPFGDGESAKANEETAFESAANAERVQAHNGWVMNDDPLRNFASEDSFVYLKRQLLPWGDSVKLRYGDKP
jgi:glycogen debranching enzyme